MKGHTGPGRPVSSLFALCAIAGLATADITNNHGVLRLVAGDYATSATNNVLALPAIPIDFTQHVAVIQLDGPMTRARNAALASAGVVLFDYLPDFAYAADLRNANLNALAALDFVTWVGQFQNAWKLAPDLGQVAAQSPEIQALHDLGLIAVQVMLWPNANTAQTLAALAAIPGFTALEHGWSGREISVSATMPLAAAQAIAALPAVRWIENTPQITLRNNTGRWIVQSNVNGSTPLYTKGIRGQGQIVGIMDGRINVNHCSFLDSINPIGPNHRKIRAYNSSLGSDSHGTHVGGTAVGDAGANNDTRGIAYEGRLVFNTVSTTPSTFLSRLETHYSQGAAVHTNSWGNDSTTIYDSLARTVDVFSYDNEDNLVIFAVTNLSTLKNPENSKNGLAVGASGDTPNQANHCSGGSGPTNDGRRKPEIYAPGCNTTSSSSGSSCGTVSYTGTSMAAPAIAGSALLARQYYTDGFYPSGVANSEDSFIPSGALLKATLLNSTVDMTGVAGYPSNREGWGRVLLANSLVFDDSPRTLIVRDVRNNSESALSTSDLVEFQVDVHSFSQPLKVTLAWHDSPGNVNANPAAVNNLDLKVIAPSGDYRGNVFSGGISTTGGTHDANNNVEMVILAAPVPGTYTVQINAAAVNIGSQGYALVISGDVSEAAPPNPCFVDWNDDGKLDFFDLQLFLADFSAQNPATDLNGDLAFNFFDLQIFLSLFSAGCP